MKFILTLLFVLTVLISFSQKNKKLNIKTGSWHSELKLNSEDRLPFDLYVDRDYNFIIKNGEEQIKLDQPIFKDDSIILKFPYFNSELVFKIISKKELNGYWMNYNKGNDYKIPCHSIKIKKESPRFSQAKNSQPINNFNGRWKVEFEPNTTSAYPAVGLFSQESKSNKIFGTFLTETGDYRFLAGNSVNDSLLLSCFDGTHAFLFKAFYKNDTLFGKFYSGKHWESEWIGVRNESFELTDPEELTYLKENSSFELSLNTIDGTPFNFPNEKYKNKVTIIQIMGTWCPNCLDETMYFKSLYEKYHSDGLEIVSVCYETGKTFEEQVASILKLKNKLEVDFDFIVGGNASKNKAANDFSMLNNIISFPTSIFIGRDGKVKLVHTGFNGPGTGKYYDEYVEKTNLLIETLLAQ